MTGPRLRLKPRLETKDIDTEIALRLSLISARAVEKNPGNCRSTDFPGQVVMYHLKEKTNYKLLGVAHCT